MLEIERQSARDNPHYAFVLRKDYGQYAKITHIVVAYLAMNFVGLNI